MKFKIKAKEMLKNSSAHGLSNLVSDKSAIVKFIWLISILASISGCFFFITRSISQYFQFDVITNIQIQNKGFLKYPAVTFCAYKYPYTNKQDVYIKNIKSCNFEKEKCNMSYFKELEILMRGVKQVCVQFNGYDPDREILEVKKLSWLGALSIEFEIDSKIEFWFTVETNRLIPPNEKVLYEIKQGSIHSKSIEITDQKRLGYPYNECIEDHEEFDSDYFRKTISFNNFYHRDKCLDICFYENYEKYCNCSLTETDDYYFNNTKCGRNNDSFKDYLESFDYHKQCYSFCPKTCNIQLYRVIEDGMKSHHTSNISKNQFREIRLYYNSLEYTEIIQIPKTTTADLVSNIGGTLGLFMGLSLLSFVEFIEFIILLFTVFIRKL